MTEKTIEVLMLIAEPGKVGSRVEVPSVHGYSREDGSPTCLADEYGYGLGYYVGALAWIGAHKSGAGYAGWSCGVAVEVPQ